MKKTFFILSFVVLAFCPLKAQDTVRIRDMRLIGRYFVPRWIDTCYPFQYQEIYSACRTFLGYNPEGTFDADEQAYQMYTDDTLQVYGIAACLTTRWYLYKDKEWVIDQIQSGLLDTSRDYMYDYLRLYEAERDSLRHIGEELLVHLNNTPVSYYVDMDLMYGNDIIRRADGSDSIVRLYYIPPLPIYERYFSTPVTVADSFYVGRRYRPVAYRSQNKQIIVPYVGDTAAGVGYLARCAVKLNVDWHKGWWYQNLGRIDFPFFFPIIAPPDTTVNPPDTVINPIDTVINIGDTVVVLPGDTIVVGGDTLVNTGDTIVVIPGEPVIIGGDTLVVNPGDSVVVNPGTPAVGFVQPDLVYRYTSVQPNPATDRVKVVSSFGLTRIEVYDTRGRLLHDLPASGLKATLDVSSWPRGTYLLRITTPVGQTTKKLLVQ